MSPSQSRSSAGITPGLSGATRVGKAVLVLLALVFTLGQSVGAVRSGWGAGAPDSPEASGNGTEEGELPLGATAASELAGASEAPGPQERGSGEFPAELGEETGGPQGSLEAREQPIRPYSQPAGTPEGPAEETAEMATQQPTPEASKKPKGRLHRLRQWQRRAKQSMKQKWEAFKKKMRWETFRMKMRKAKELARRHMAKILARLPKVRRRRAPTAPGREVLPWPPTKEVYPLSPEDEAILAELPEECGRAVRELPPTLREIWRTFPQYCFLWTLFDRDGKLSAKKEQMVGLAQELSTNLNAAKDLEPGRGDPEALQLRMQQAVAKHEDALADLRPTVDLSCWFLDPDKIYAQADSKERKKLDSSPALSSATANPCEMLKAAPAVWKLARKDMEVCMPKGEDEANERRDLRNTLLKHIKALQPKGDGDEKEAGSSIIRDLDLLYHRETCSLIRTILIQEQIAKIWEWMEAFEQRSVLTRGRVPTDRCGPPPKDTGLIATFLTRSCEKFRTSQRPTSTEEAAPGMAWMWEAADVREEEEE